MTEGLSREEFEKWEELTGRVVVTLHMTVHAPLTGKHFDECDKPCCKQLRELRQAAASSLKQAEPEYCHAQKDGDCDWAECPQLKNYQDHCPLAAADDAFYAIGGDEQ